MKEEDIISPRLSVPLTEDTCKTEWQLAYETHQMLKALLAISKSSELKQPSPPQSPQSPASLSR